MPQFIQPKTDDLVNLILRVAQEQGLCYPKNNVMVFIGENEGTPKENYTFKLIKIPEELQDLEGDEEGEAE